KDDHAQTRVRVKEIHRQPKGLIRRSVVHQNDLEVVGQSGRRRRHAGVELAQVRGRLVHRGYDGQVDMPATGRPQRRDACHRTTSLDWPYSARTMVYGRSLTSMKTFAR